MSFHLFAKTELNEKISLYPVFHATLIGFNFKMVNTLGVDTPEGRLLSVENTGNVADEEYYVEYLSTESKGRTSQFSAGGIVSFEILKNLEIGGGLLYTTRRTWIRDYNAEDLYIYYGATGTHTNHYQTDEYEYNETTLLDKPVNEDLIMKHQLSLPVMVKYNITAIEGFDLSPVFIAYLGNNDMFFNLSLYLTFNFAKLKDDEQE